MIDSKSNATIKKIAKLKQKKYRDLENKYLVEGRNLINELTDKGYPVEIYTSNADFEGTLVSKEVIQYLSSVVTNQEIIGVCTKTNNNTLKSNRILLLNDVQDPGNLGTIIRTALAFGFKEIYASKGCVDLYNPKVVRSALGAIHSINYQEVDLIKKIEELKKDDFKVYGTYLDTSAKPLCEFERTDKIAIILGNESNGISNEVVSRADSKLYVKINDIESLNVAVACGVVLNHFKDV